MNNCEKSNTISVCATVMILLICVIPMPASATERQYVELGKTYTIQGGWGSGYMIFQKYVLVNASDNLSVNWKTGVKGDMSNFWELDINIYSPALNWSNNLTENAVHYQVYSNQGIPPLSLWVRPSVNTMVYIAFITFGNFADQTFNITVNRTQSPVETLQMQINDLKAQMNVLTDTVNLLNLTVTSMEQQIFNLTMKVTELGTAVGNNTKEIKDLQNQLAVLQTLYNSLAENMTDVQDFINSLNVTGHNVTVVYQNITKLYNNITNLTKFTSENVTKTIMIYQNTTKTINSYDNKTLGAMANNLTKASEDVTDLAMDLNKITNSTATKGDLKTLDRRVDSLKNTTAKKTDLDTMSLHTIIASAVTMMITLTIAGVLHGTNKRRIKKHDDSITQLMEGTNPVSKTDIKKAGARKVGKEDKF
jgi:hypothetical protein